MKLSQKVFSLKWAGVLLIVLTSCTKPSDYTPSYTWSPVEINDEIEGSENIEAIIAPYRLKLDSIMDEVIGYAAHDLNMDGQYETTLGTFVTKLLLEQSVSVFKREVDVAIMNHKGGLRATLNEGTITQGEVFEIMPFENDVILLEIPSDTLLKVIDHISTSGRSMIWPVQFHVSETGVENILINGEPIVSDKNYILSISDYLANGGGGFKMLKSLKRLDVEPIKLRDLITQEIKQQAAQGDSIKIEVANFVTTSTP